ncbi:MAG: class I SAM-dependent methyltransferase [Steroidobacteraceae bacterium]
MNVPKPDAAAMAHSRRVQEAALAAIEAAGGWISFAAYMQLVLHAPGLGYYSAGSAKFGAEGDFVTAPELSPLYARVCAREIDRLLRAQGGGALLELGPGTGAFANEAIDRLRQLASPLLAYELLEISADLRARQRERIGDPLARWLDSLPVPAPRIVFANEIIDALPVERFVVREGGWWRLGVGSGEGLEWRVREADGRAEGDAAFAQRAAMLADELRHRGVTLPEGYCGEWHPQLHEWVAALASTVERGALLFADYGLPRAQLYHPDRVQGSLRCHYRHHAHGDPFVHPGLTDITTWVDFTAVAEAGEAAGMQVAGFTTQAAFLLGGGLQAELQLATAQSSDPVQTARRAAGVRQLMLPGEMGEAVKLMLLTRGVEAEGEAFALRDLRDSL